MNEATYRAWAELHRRTVYGETLAESEQAAYAAGCAAMDAEEDAILRRNSMERLRRMRTAIAEAEAEQARLLGRQAEMKARIAALEARFSGPTRQALGIRN